jgi:hypothetical protein
MKFIKINDSYISVPKWCDVITGSPLTDSNIGGVLLDCEILENGEIIEKEILCNYSKNIKTGEKEKINYSIIKHIDYNIENTEPVNTETQNTELTPEEIEKQKKIEALEKTLEALKNS